jgi:hypothetical protein
VPVSAIEFVGIGCEEDGRSINGCAEDRAAGGSSGIGAMQVAEGERRARRVAAPEGIHGRRRV